MEPKGELYQIFADESSTDKHQTHMVYGGVCMSAATAARLTDSIDKWKADLLDPPSEFHWSNLSPHRLKTYKSLSLGAIHHAKQQAMMFRSIVFEKRKIDYARFHKGDRELGFYKFWYQFLLHAFSDWVPAGCRIQVYLDERTTKYSLAELLDCLNSGIRKKCGHQRTRVVSVEPLDSRSSHFMQMADVLAGAVSHQNNRHRIVAGSKRGVAKESLSAFIQELVGREPFTAKVATPHFEVWHFRPNEKTP